MNIKDFKTGMRVVYKGEQRPGYITSPTLEGKLGTVFIGLPRHSDECVGVIWDTGRTFGVYPWNVRVLHVEGRNKL